MSDRKEEDLTYRELFPTNPGDWPEDMEHDNGSYVNKCRECEKDFIGHKRRITCKTCALTTVTGEDNAE